MIGNDDPRGEPDGGAEPPPRGPAGGWRPRIDDQPRTVAGREAPADADADADGKAVRQVEPTRQGRAVQQGKIVQQGRAVQQGKAVFVGEAGDAGVAGGWSTIVAGAERTDPAETWSIAGSWQHADASARTPIPDRRRAERTGLAQPGSGEPGPAAGPGTGPVMGAGVGGRIVPGAGSASGGGLASGGGPASGYGPASDDGPASGAGLGDGGAAPGANELEPELDDPLLAAMRYRRMLGASDVARARAGRDAHQRRQGSRAQARRHRDAAADIRRRVDRVWEQVAEPLAQYGLTDLDQLRPAVEPVGQPVSLGKGRVNVHKGDPRGGEGGRRGGEGGRRGGEGGRRRSGTPLAHAGRERELGAGRAGLASGAVTTRGGRRRRGGEPAPVAGAPVDPRTAPRHAYELCLDAMSKAAELRAVTKGGGSASAGLMTAIASLLSLVLIGLLRVFAHAPGLPCIIGAMLVAGALVAAAAGAEGGPKAVLRAAMLGAGCASVAVLATFRLAPTDAVAVAAALLSLAAAARFGLGLGAPTEQQSASGARAGGSRKG